MTARPHAEPGRLMLRGLLAWPARMRRWLRCQPCRRPRPGRPRRCWPAAWGPGMSVRAAEPIWDRAHVVRLHLAAGRSVVMKKRADKDTFGVELAALEYLNGMPEPVAPRLLGADADAGIVLMEDLGPGPSLADSLLTGDRPRVRADLVSYAEALGSMHAWTMGRPGPPPGEPALAGRRRPGQGRFPRRGRLAGPGRRSRRSRDRPAFPDAERTGIPGPGPRGRLPRQRPVCRWPLPDLRFRALRLGRGHPRRVLPAGALPELLVLRPPARLGGRARHVGLPRPARGGGHRAWDLRGT